jgi:alpha-tubulin suppressor-like RCC1 family protein
MPVSRRHVLTVVLCLLTVLAVPARAATPMTWSSVSTGSGDATCAIRSDGTLWCWGHNFGGMLGDGTDVHRGAPVRVGDARNWASVSPGTTHTCATRIDGSLWCWGGNTYGQLGLGDAGTSTPRPARVGTAPWASVSTSSQASCAIRTDRSLWCWGSNANHMLGDGTGTDRWSPTRIGTQTWAAVDLGASHTCGIRTDRTLWCWGFGLRGELGIGPNQRSRTVPVQVGTAATWTALATTQDHTCAVDTGHALWCWGGNEAGRLGDGTVVDRDVPVRAGAGTSWASVAAGMNHTCAVTTDGRTRCWGENDNGELGDGTTVSSSGPVTVNADLTTRTVVAGLRYSCALTTAGRLWCWGDNVGGLLGDGTFVPSTSVPSAVRVGDGTDWADVAVGERHTCAVRTSGSLWCWGDNAYGQVADGLPRWDLPLTRVRTDVATTWADVTAADRHTCGRDTAGKVWCWGEDFLGQRGDGAATTAGGPVGLAGVVSLDAGYVRSCAVDADHRLWCWGGGVTPLFAAPRPITADRDWADIAVSSSVDCGIRTDASLWCWGGNNAGQLGDGTATDRDEPVRSGRASWLTVAPGGSHTCGIRTDRSLWCWGDNAVGQLGRALTVRRVVPVP